MIDTQFDRMLVVNRSADYRNRLKSCGEYDTPEYWTRHLDGLHLQNHLRHARIARRRPDLRAIGCLVAKLGAAS